MAGMNVKAVSALTGVSPHTLRAWERRYHAITPDRSETGRRLYSEKEVKRLQRLALLTARGHSIGNIANLTDAKLESLLQKGGAKPESSPQATQNLVARLITALRSYHLREVAHELEWARASLGCRDLVLQVVSPLIGEVGRLVMTHELSIAQEHALSSILRDQIGQILQLLQNHRPPLSSAGTRRFLLTTPEGDFHEFGILLSAALCANYGLTTHYLGPNLPAQALLDAAAALETNFVILGNSPIPPDRRREPLADYLRELERGFNKSTEVWIGGQGALPALPKRFRYFRSLAELDQALSALNVG